MIAPVERKNKSQKVTLIEKSNIQFLDYEALVNTKTKDPLDKAYLTTYFNTKKLSTGQRLIQRYRPILKNIDDQDVKYRLDEEHILEDVANSDDYVELVDALHLYHGVWFPVPLLSRNANTSRLGPIDWVRCRIVEVAINEDDLRALGDNAKFTHKYHVTFAIDTNVSKQQTARYIIPSQSDVTAGDTFSLTTFGALTDDFICTDENSSPWINEWVKDVFTQLVESRLKRRLDDYSSLSLQQFTINDMNLSEVDKAIKRGIDIVMYLSVLSFLENFIELKELCLVSNTKDAVGVSLVLDVGNSRSCGLLVEDLQSIEDADDNFSNAYKLELRDLNAPERVYNDPFESRVEFTKASFAFNQLIATSHNDKSFLWPSIARVGTEASILAAHRDGSAGRSGTSSPKRYLWSIYSKPDDADWYFNDFSYQTKFKLTDADERADRKNGQFNNAGVVNDSIIGQYINYNGDALFALDDYDGREGFSSKFSYKSTMTFMLMEVFLQALTQINSFRQRSKSKNIQRPRYLKSIILTIPPSMPQQEREIFRSCAYEAVGILWKSLGYDENPREVFYLRERPYLENYKVIEPMVPSIHMDWNEAECCQVVYLYNEAQKIFKGRCKDYISFLRSKNADGRACDKLVDNNKGDEQSSYISARIASIDIGGGTTDLVIRDYSFRKEGSDSRDTIIPSEIFSDGFKLAGDDIVKELIQDHIIKAMRDNLKDKTADPRLIERFFSNSKSDIDKATLKTLVLQQILIKVAYRIIFNLELLKDNCEQNFVTGTLKDFLEGTEQNDNISDKERSLIQKPEPAGLPEPQIVSFINSEINAACSVKTFSVLDVELKVDLVKINKDLILGNLNICRALDPLAEIVEAYRVDVLLLSGRPSKIPGVKKYFTQRVNIPSSRIIPMHTYHCKDWYPFNTNISDTISDPKTTVAVGALINLIKTTMPRRLANFKYVVNVTLHNPQIRYFGRIDDKSMLLDEDVFYEYVPENNSKNLLRENDEHTLILPNSDIKNIFTSSNDSWRSINNGEESDSKEFIVDYQIDLGYRQLKSPSFPATPLYSLKVIDTPMKSEYMYMIKQAEKEDIFDLFNMNSEFLHANVKEEFAAKVKDLKQKINEIDSYIASFKANSSPTSALEALEINTSDSIVTLKLKYKDLLNRAMTDASLLVDKQMSEQNVGFFAKTFGKAKREQEREEQIKAEFVKRRLDLEMDLRAEISKMHDDLLSDKEYLSWDINDANYNAFNTDSLNMMKEANQATLDNLDIKVQIKVDRVVGYVKNTACVILYRDFIDHAKALKNSSNVYNDYFDGQYDLRKEIFTTGVYRNRLSNIHPTLMCEIENLKIKTSNTNGMQKNLKAVYELALQTVTASEKEFWVDNGTLDFGK